MAKHKHVCDACGDELFCAACGNGLETHFTNNFLTFTDAGSQIGKNRNTIARWVRDGLMDFHRYPTGQMSVRQNQINGILRVSSMGIQVVGEPFPVDIRGNREQRIAGG